MWSDTKSAKVKTAPQISYLSNLFKISECSAALRNVIRQFFVFINSNFMIGFAGIGDGFVYSMIRMLYWLNSDQTKCKTMHTFCLLVFSLKSCLTTVNVI